LNKLFEKKDRLIVNLLPYNGEAYYYGKIFEKNESSFYYKYLFNQINWLNDQVIIYGKLITTRRKTAWFGNKPYNYTYSKITRKALPWTNELLFLKKRVEQFSGETFNSCLLNLYHDGSEGMSWHRDAESDLIKDGAIASLSFGAERIFNFRNLKTSEKVNILLEDASLLIMKGKTQTYWAHQIPLSKKIRTPRINLTFRTICEEVL
jgi:alkylated DNA repair dioxygenase AlkB